MRHVPAHPTPRPASPGRRLIRILLPVLLIAWCGAGNARAAAPTEDQVKAAFVLNFPKYIEWPAESYPDEKAPIVLTVLGDERLEEELRRMAVGKLYNGRPVHVHGAASLQEVESASRIVFVGTAEKKCAPDLVSRARDSALLTIGEWEDFLAAGGMINLARRDRRISLEINLPAVEGAGLKVSSKMLSVAEVVLR